MSDTPETDKTASHEGSWDTKALRMTDKARRLERERDEARRIAEEGRLGRIPSNRVFPWETAS